MRTRTRKNPRLTDAQLQEVSQRLGAGDEDLDTEFHSPEAARRLTQFSAATLPPIKPAR